ncbi:hypothetical protein G6O69_18090 [Pseudenhygromyxa sp. WMMC2535]|uniref:hypothetical protein n=1 Tax=Pseudenhygromyxa sp. WMMC2535 TaxID=2712867 RepID=UPI0015581726|nr:hypothetical protein [Pseudenhygromyxa sp. WMMC2535]NVB39760.1 hypothetical protein [Pseudenhygromyxa sp. WMMC2535]
MTRRLGLIWLGTALSLVACKHRPTADIGQATALDGGDLQAPEAAGQVQDGEGASLGPRWVDIAIESEFGCAVERTGGVYCWGRGPAAEMALRELPAQPSTDPLDFNSTRKWGPASRLAMIHDATKVSTASSLGCAVVEGGRVRCWGAARWGAHHLYDIPGIEHAVDIEISDGQSCALLEGGALWCWGVDDYGIPRQRLDNVIAVTASDSLGCGLTAQGEVLCWGQPVSDWHRYNVQLNAPPGTGGTHQPPSEDQDFPDTMEVGRFHEAVDIMLSGWNNLCVLRSDGRVMCSEHDLFSLLRGEELAMREVGGNPGVQSFESSRSHKCQIDAQGKVQCWGRNVYGQLGDGTATMRDAPTPVVGLEGVVALSLSEDLSCAATRAGTISCWGFDRGEAMGREDVHVNTIEGLRAGSLAASGRTTCAVDDTQTLRCWGTDMIEQLGIQVGSTPTPIDLPSMAKGLRAMSSGWEACFLGESGQLQCGNWSTSGASPSPLPTPSSAGSAQAAPSFNVTITNTDVRDLAAGPPPLCTIIGKSGRSELQCGKDVASLRVESKLKAPTSVSAANMRACVIHDGGKVGCFGDYYFWDQQPPPREITKIPGISQALDLVSSNFQDCALRKDGRVTCWVGRTETTWTDDGSHVKAVSYKAQTPKDIGIDSVVQLVAGGTKLCALDKRGGVRCWADNPYSETLVWLEVPELGGDVAQLAAGSEHVCARHKDGRVTCWGDDTWGQLGHVPGRVYLEPHTLPVD